MEQSTAAKKPLLFTVGHSNHSVEVFVDLLRKHGINVVVDTRSHPYSKYVHHFNREPLASALEHEKIDYVYMGDELGGRPVGEEFYDDDGRVLYYRVAEAPYFLRGIERLEKGSREFRVAIMCSEEDPTGCHRHLLVSKVIARRGTEVIHIRGDGSLVAESTLQAEGNEQPTLFDDPADESQWKSLKPIAKNKPLTDDAS